MNSDLLVVLTSSLSSKLSRCGRCHRTSAPIDHQTLVNGKKTSLHSLRSNCIYPIPKSDRPKADGGASRQTQKSAVEQCRELRRGRLRGERDFCSGTHLKVTWKWKRLIGKTFPDMAPQELFHSRQFLPKGAATQPRGACRADLRALFHPQGRRFSLPRSPRRAVKDQGDATEGRP